MTSTIKKNEKFSRKVRALPVYSLTEGLYLGTVRLLLIDPVKKQIVALLLERRRLAKEEKILPFEAITSIGDDAITIQNAADIQKKGAFAQYTRLMRQPIQPIGARCFTAGGNTLGRIDEYRFDCDSGKISGLEITADGLFKEKILINGSHIMSMSSHTIMLSDRCIDDYQVIDNSLLSSVETAKDKAAAAARGTFEASKKFSHNISSKLKNIEEFEVIDEENNAQIKIVNVKDEEAIDEKINEQHETLETVDKKIYEHVETLETGDEEKNELQLKYKIDYEAKIIESVKDNQPIQENVIGIEDELPSEESTNNNIN